MSIGLDLGCTQFRSLRLHAGRLTGRITRTCYALVADTAAHRRVFDRDRVNYVQGDGQLLLLGDSAEDWAPLLQVGLIPLLADGQFPNHDPCARQLLSLLFDAVLPAAQSTGDICTLTIPGELLPSAASPERDFFCQLVRQRGYEPRVIGQGLAVALAELGASGFSGVGVSLGASQCEFALVRGGIELARCAIPWGTADLDQTAQPAEPSPGVLPLAPPARDQATEDFLTELLLEAGARIAQQDGFRVLTQPVAVACNGGIARRRALQQMLPLAWRRAGWPIALQEIRIAADPTYTVARGCLIHAQLELETAALRAAA